VSFSDSGLDIDYPALDDTDPNLAGPDDNSVNDNGGFAPPDMSQPGDPNATQAVMGNDAAPGDGTTKTNLPAAGGIAPDDPVALAQQHNASLASGGAFGGAPTGPASNTATFSGDPSSGQTYGTPTPTSPTASTYDAIVAAQTGPGSGSLTRPTTPQDLASVPGLPPAGGIAPPMGDQSHFNTRLGAEAPAAPSAAGGDLNANQRLVTDAAGNVTGVRSLNGYYDPNFQSTDNMLRNYQSGDRMAGTIDALRILAEMGNKNAQAVLGAEQATGSNMMSSQLEANWARAHNAQIGNELPGLANNRAAQANLQGQIADVNQSPLSNADAFPMGQKMMQGLEQLKDVTPNSVHMDSGGNIVFQDASGIRHIPMDQWADWSPVIANKVALQTTANAPAPPSGNLPTSSPPSGRYAPPRGNAPPRGGGSGGGAGAGGNAPPASATTDFSAAAAGAPGIPTQGTENLYKNNPALLQDYLNSPAFDANNLQQAGVPINPNASIYRRGQPY